MQVRNNTQVTQDRSSSPGTQSKIARSVIDQIKTEPTTAETLSSGSSTAEQLSDQPAESRVPIGQKQQFAEYDAVERLGKIDIGAIAGVFKSQIVVIQDRIEQLEANLEMAGSPEEHKFIGAQLNAARQELKAESLRLIENELRDRNDTPRADGDAPRGPVGTGTMTRADFEALAAGDENDPLAIAARTILNEPNGFESIAGEDTTVNFRLPFVGSTSFTVPATMTLGEIQAARLDAEKDIENVAEKDDGDADYEVPEGDDFTIGSTANEVEIGQAAFDAQQDAIEESIRTGEEVEFVNSVGDTVGVTVTPNPGSGNDTASYSVQVREGSRTDTFNVDSEIGTENTIASIANIVDWGSSLAVAGPNVPAYPTVVQLRQERDPVAAASVFGSTGTMLFYNGTANINRATYVHEMGHIIGYALNDASTEEWRFSPAGWEEVLAGAEGDVSQYLLNPQEEFSEALAAYANAAEHGPEALAAFREAFPDRSAYIEENILGTQKPVVEPEEEPAKPVFPLPPFPFPMPKVN